MTSTCSSKVPKYVKGKRKDEEFVPMTKDEKKADDVLKQMRYVKNGPIGLP